MTKEYGPVVGEYRDEDIHEWFVEGGNRFEFVRIAKEDKRGCVSLDQLERGDVVIAPGLIYKRAAIDKQADPVKELTTTPAAKWRDAGEADPHAGRYDCERHQLPCGSMTDDELANAVFLHDHAKFDLDAILAGAPSSIALLTAAKERIRWLSRQAANAEQKINFLEKEVKALKCNAE